MKKILKDYFSFNSRERVAILLLCCLMAFFWVLPYWYPNTRKIPDTLGWKQQEVDSEKTPGKVSIQSPERAAIVTSEQLFKFNPNELSADGWKKLGLHSKTVQTILHYRQKGGKFREPEDLKKIWGMPLEQANQLIPYVRIPESEKTELKPKFQEPKKMPASILINQATVADLMLIPGFNQSLAARMIKFRDKLGGFQSLDQVRKTYGLNDSLYQLMAPFLVF